MVIFTSICANYLHKARTLAKSVKKHIPDATFIVCMTERERIPAMESPYFDKVVLSKDMWNGNFNRYIFKHAIVEASTAVKGQFFRYLYTAYPDEAQFVYLDPDCYVYSDFVELRELLKKHPIVVCPHVLEPGNIDMELSSTAHGVYNLGFLGVNRSEEDDQLVGRAAVPVLLRRHPERRVHRPEVDRPCSLLFRHLHLQAPRLRLCHVAHDGQRSGETRRRMVRAGRAASLCPFLRLRPRHRTVHEKLAARGRKGVPRAVRGLLCRARGRQRRRCLQDALDVRQLLHRRESAARHPQRLPQEQRHHVRLRRPVRVQQHVLQPAPRRVSCLAAR